MAYKQAQKRKKRLLKTYKETKNSCYAGVWFDERKGYYRKFCCSNTPGYTKSLRRLSNKRVRRTKALGNFSSYKKIYDYKWTLF